MYVYMSMYVYTNIHIRIYMHMMIIKTRMQVTGSIVGIWLHKIYDDTGISKTFKVLERCKLMHDCNAPDLEILNLFESFYWASKPLMKIVNNRKDYNIRIRSKLQLQHLHDEMESYKSTKEYEKVDTYILIHVYTYIHIHT
jgi:hypothetical protein